MQAVLDALPSMGTPLDQTTLQTAIKPGIKTALTSLKLGIADVNVTIHTFPSLPMHMLTGLEFCIAPCNDWEVHDSKCILTKPTHGTTPGNLVKHRKKVGITIKTSFVSNSVICIMSQHKINNHDIVKEAQQ